MSSTTLSANPTIGRFTLRHVAAFGAFLAATMFAASGILQLADLHWVVNKVQTMPQHLDMALFALAVAATLPALYWLGQRIGGAARVAAGSVILGQLIICAITTQSNISGIDASWFNTAAVVANLLWVPPLIALVVLAFRSGAVPRPLAAGLVVAYIGTIPLASHGGGLLAAAYWATLAVYVAKETS